MLRRLIQFFQNGLHLRRELDALKISQGQLHAQLNRQRRDEILDDLRRAEFKVFSQWGDDGIIEFLVDYLDIENQRFVEFGVENYREANTRFLLLNRNWSGLILDGSEKNMAAVRAENLYWQQDLSACAAFVTAENINDLLAQNGFTGPIGLLHIDIDGNDYWVWRAIEVIEPAIVVMEYNSVFGPENAWTVPYDPAFVRTKAHHSNLFFGSSLRSLCDLAEEKGYAFVGSNSHGVNAYFVKKDRLKNLRPLTVEEGYVESKFRESRDAAGNLTFLSGKKRLESLRGMTVFNTRTQRLETI